MNRIIILSLEDESEVRQAIIRDLEPFAPLFGIEAAEDVNDARGLIQALTEEGARVGVILCDHRLPGTSGVDFLAQLETDPTQQGMRKVLVTGQADQQDTIRAINSGGLDRYLGKPWKAGELQQVVKEQLTEFLLDQKIDPVPYLGLLDDPRLLGEIGRSDRID